MRFRLFACESLMEEFVQTVKKPGVCQVAMSTAAGPKGEGKERDMFRAW